MTEPSRLERQRMARLSFVCCLRRRLPLRTALIQSGPRPSPRGLDLTGVSIPLTPTADPKSRQSGRQDPARHMMSDVVQGRAEHPARRQHFITFSMR